MLTCERKKIDGFQKKISNKRTGTYEKPKFKDLLMDIWRHVQKYVDKVKKNTFSSIFDEKHDFFYVFRSPRRTAIVVLQSTIFGHCPGSRRIGARTAARNLWSPRQGQDDRSLNETFSNYSPVGLRGCMSLWWGVSLDQLVVLLVFLLTWQLWSLSGW